MRMQKKQFRIGQLAKEIGVERFVIRFWEKEFNVYGNRSEGGQRFYEQKDLIQFEKIKELLYKQGYTITGAKKYFQKLQKNGIYSSESLIGSVKTDMEKQEPSPHEQNLSQNKRSFLKEEEGKALITTLTFLKKLLD